MEKGITKEPKTVSHPPAQSEPDGGEPHVNGKSSGIRYASDEQFAKAHQKTSARHAGLFRRLAQ